MKKQLQTTTDEAQDWAVKLRRKSPVIPVSVYVSGIAVKSGDQCYNNNTYIYICIVPLWHDGNKEIKA